MSVGASGFGASRQTARRGLVAADVAGAALSAVAGLMLSASAVLAFAQPQTAPAQATTPSQRGANIYAIVYRPGPAYQTGVPIMQQPLLPPHGVYMRHLVDTGVTLAAGPMFTPDGGLVLIRADNLEQAQAYMAADPAVSSGLFVGQVSLWRPLLDPQGRFRR